MSNISLGIDISKLELSTALLQENKVKKSKFSNDNSGFKKLHQWLSKNKAATPKICMEATGHYWFNVADFLYKEGYQVYVANPFCIKSFGDSQLSRNKTDEADALIIAQYIRQNDVREYKPIPENIAKLRDLYKCLDAMKTSRAEIRTRVSDAEHLSDIIINSWKKILENLNSQITNIEEEIKNLIYLDIELKQHYVNLQTIPGVSSTTAATILALIPDISNFNNARQLAAFAGLTPRQRSSGTSVRGKTKLAKIGSKKLRKAMFFPAMSAKTHNPIIKKFCENLKKKSKPKMAIIGAAMRKLMHIIFGVMKNKTAFNPDLI